MPATTPARLLPPIQPLTARSVVLSTLLGYHPPELPAQSLIRVGALFEMAERSMRVALGRMVADGDLILADGRYRLNDRLVERQAAQEEACSPRVRRWRGAWEMAVVTAPPRPLAERVALRRHMVALRLAELREGVWVRPANLARPVPGPVLEQCTFFEGRPEADAVALARTLWDLDGWATEARRLQETIVAASSLTDGFLVVAEVIRHLRIDPVLPPELLPDGWPGDRLRSEFADFQAGFADRLRAYSASRAPSEPTG